ncbi:hypothetical protein BHE74_00028962 [Ensete ventricosum]|nr:hypothetical protein GW17_00057306 [Ensete ventricosum]RWW63840.1 hypothetical protein BHE74_00028962 [Ensete ventricosum]RZS07404.1 hypothetical protein BHM03_00038230 [Ensete ventricosum]
MQRINRLWKQLSRSVGGRVIAESVTVACAEAQRKPWTWGRECVGVVPVSVDAWSKRTQGFRFLHNVEENNVVKMQTKVGSRSVKIACLVFLELCWLYNSTQRYHKAEDMHGIMPHMRYMTLQFIIY